MSLTQRQTQVLGLIASGYTNERIGEALGISTETVRTHVENVLRRLKVHNRATAVAIAIRNGLLDAEDCPWGCQGCGYSTRQFTCNNCGATNLVSAPGACQLCGHMYGIYVLPGGAA